MCLDYKIESPPGGKPRELSESSEIGELERGDTKYERTQKEKYVPDPVVVPLYP